MVNRQSANLNFLLLLHVLYFRLQASYFRFQTSYFRLQTSYFILHTSYFRPPTSDLRPHFTTTTPSTCLAAPNSSLLAMGKEPAMLILILPANNTLSPLSFTTFIISGVMVKLSFSDAPGAKVIRLNPFNENNGAVIPVASVVQYNCTTS